MITFEVKLSNRCIMRLRKGLKDQDGLEDNDSDEQVIKELFLLQTRYDVLDLRHLVKVRRLSDEER